MQGVPKAVELTPVRAQRIMDPDAQHAEGDQPAAERDTGAEQNGQAPSEMQQDDQQSIEQLEDPSGMQGDADKGDDDDASQQNQGQNGKAGTMDVDVDAAAGEQQQEQQDEKVQDPVSLWSGLMLGVLQARCTVDQKPLTTDQVLLWMDQEQVGAFLDYLKLGLRGSALLHVHDPCWQASAHSCCRLSMSFPSDGDLESVCLSKSLVMLPGAQNIQPPRPANACVCWCAGRGQAWVT